MKYRRPEGKADWPSKYIQHDHVDRILLPAAGRVKSWAVHEVGHWGEAGGTYANRYYTEARVEGGVKGEDGWGWGVDQVRWTAGWQETQLGEGLDEEDGGRDEEGRWGWMQQMKYRSGQKDEGLGGGIK